MKSLIKLSLPVLSLCLLASCADSGKGTPGFEQTQNEVVREDGSNIEGIYAADVWPVNYNLHFKKIGAVGIVRDGDTFSAKFRIKYAPKSTTLRPALYTGRRCPNITDDLNKDAYIDILEARLAIGKITIPFDADLDSQMAGRGSYQSSDETGKYAYDMSASFSRMFEDLKGEDENSHDQMIKLPEGEGLTLPGRIILFHGMDKKIKLPESVASTDGDSANSTIPVACAVLWKVRSLPAELAE